MRSLALVTISFVLVLGGACRSTPTLTLELSGDSADHAAEVERLLAMAQVAHRAPDVRARRITVELDRQIDPGHRRLIERALERLKALRPVGARPGFSTVSGATVQLSRGTFEFQAPRDWPGKTARCIWQAPLVPAGAGAVSANDHAYDALAARLRRETNDRVTLILVEAGKDASGSPPARFEGLAANGEPYRFEFGECGPAVLQLGDDDVYRALAFPSLSGRVASFAVEWR
ncbi:MAG TPA: hypothetical protein VFF06_13925 [Polyangia bacterium]|nr:hypothetical protein [Polyangia bacterium]